MAFFQGYSESTSNFYAGIFDTTNLGPPITASDADATWRGQFQAIGTTAVNTDFTLEVTFGGEADAAGSIEALVTPQPGFSYFVKGTFSDRGVITGTTAFGPFTIATLKADRDWDPRSLNRAYRAGGRGWCVSLHHLWWRVCRTESPITRARPRAGSSVLKTIKIIGTLPDLDIATR